MTALADRVAAAPITWGVCEVPGWGYQIPAETYLDDIVALGLHATELGPDGFLPSDPDTLATLVTPRDLSVVAGFVPAVLYRPELLDDALAYVRRAAATLAGVGASVMVLGADGAAEGYEERVVMDDEDWRHFAKGLSAVQTVASEHGLEVALHPHWGMVIETEHEVERLLATSDIGLCIDTGHLALAGADPERIASLAGDRVRHVHLKDLDATIASAVRRGELGYRAAVAAGLYRPLGAGDLDIAGFVGLLESRGYPGWYVLEQDAVVDPETGHTAGLEAARMSLDHLTEISDRLDRNEGSPISGIVNDEGRTR